jgi:hypothetical protein
VKRLVEPHAAGVEERELGRVADHDQRALARADDVVDRLPQLRPRRDALERAQQLRVAPRIILRRGAREAERGGGL